MIRREALRPPACRLLALLGLLLTPVAFVSAQAPGQAPPTSLVAPPAPPVTPVPAAPVPAAPVPPATLPVPGTAHPAEGQLIDLPTSLRLAGAGNLDLALVREAQNQAKAASDAALLRFFPWLSVGTSYAKHTGAGQDFPGDVVDVDKALYASAVSVNMQLDLGSAVFQRLASQQRQSAAGYDSDAKRNDTTLAAATAYFDLVNAVANSDIARDAVRISQGYEHELERAAEAGLTNRSDVLRVSVQTQRAQIVLRQAEAAVQTASVALATLLRLDASIRLLPAERIIAPTTLVPLDRPAAELVRDALGSRPELKGSAAAVAAADQLRIAAKYGPLIPSLNAQALYGRLKGGANGFIGDQLGSHDYIVGLSWRLGPGGLFDFSRTELAQSQLRQQRLKDQKLRDTIAQQVADAYEAAHAGFDQISLARRAAELARKSLDLSEQRRQFGVYAVLEVIQAQQDLTQARRDYAQALAQYAKAQYSLARATSRLGGASPAAPALP